MKCIRTLTLNSLHASETKLHRLTMYLIVNGIPSLMLWHNENYASLCLGFHIILHYAKIISENSQGFVAAIALS